MALSFLSCGYFGCYWRRHTSITIGTIYLGRRLPWISSVVSCPYHGLDGRFFLLLGGYSRSISRRLSRGPLTRRHTLCRFHRDFIFGHQWCSPTHNGGIGASWMLCIEDEDAASAAKNCSLLSFVSFVFTSSSAFASSDPPSCC